MAALRRRADLVADQLAHPPYGSRRFAADAPPVRVGATGTGASLLVLAWSAADLAREKTAGARVLQGLGLRAGMRVANTLAGALVTPGSLLLGDVIEELGALDVPLGATDSDAAAQAAVDLFDRVEPGVVVVDQATAPRFFAATGGRPRHWWHGIVWLRRGDEPWTPAEPPPEFEGWQRTWLAVPEVACFVAATCAEGRLHADRDVEAEIVAGGLVIGRVGSGVRYASGIAAATGACGCGATGTVILA